MKTKEEKRCAVSETIDLISAKWKPCILCHLLDSRKRFGQLLRNIPNVSKKMLAQHLKELQADGLISKRSYGTIPPRVDYFLTDKGRSLEPVLFALENWGLTNLQRVHGIEDMMVYAAHQK